MIATVFFRKDFFTYKYIYKKLRVDNSLILYSNFNVMRHKTHCCDNSRSSIIIITCEFFVRKRLLLNIMDNLKNINLKEKKLDFLIDVDFSIQKF